MASLNEAGGCDYCREFGGTDDVASAADGTILSLCPRCRTYYQTRARGRRQTRIDYEEAQGRFPDLSLAPPLTGFAVPDLLGMQALEVMDMATRAGLTVYDATTAEPLVPAPAVVTDQWPKPGEELFAGDVFTVRTNRRPSGEWRDPTGVREPLLPGPSGAPATAEPHSGDR